MGLLQRIGETMIEVGDLVRRRGKIVHTPGVWLVIELGGWQALCTQGSRRMWFWLESLEKL